MEELQHVGVLGMHWGHRKSPSDGIHPATHRMAKKDAQRFMDAKMFYGETAGTKRKLLNAELDKKRKSIPGYEQAFNTHLENVDKARSARKAVSTRNRIDNAAKGRKLLKNVLGVTGSLAVGVASMAYAANKPAVDNFVKTKSKQLLKEISKRVH